MNKIGKNAKWRVNAFCSVCLCECVCVYKKKQVRWKQSDLYLMALAFDVNVWSYLSQRTIVQWSKNIYCKLDWTEIIVDNRMVLWYTILENRNHNNITWFLTEYLSITMVHVQKCFFNSLTHKYIYLSHIYKCAKICNLTCITLSLSNVVFAWIIYAVVDSWLYKGSQLQRKSSPESLFELAVRCISQL